MPTLFLSNKALAAGVAGAAAVQTAVAWKNTLEQKPDNVLAPLGPIPPKVLFALGWAGFAASIAMRSQDKIKGILAFVGAAAVVGAVFHVKARKAEGNEPLPYVAMMFPLGWAAVAAAIMYKGGPLRLLGPVGTGMVLLSMMSVLPWQRKHMVVDGPGYNLFSMAWVALVLGNVTYGLKRN